MEKGSTPGGIRARWLKCWGAQLRSHGALLGVFGWWSCAGWDLSLFLPSFSLVFFSQFALYL